MLYVAPIDSFFHEMNLFDTDKSIQSNNMIATYSQFLGPAGHFWSTGRQWSILKFWYSFWYLKPFFLWRAAKTKSIKLIIIDFICCTLLLWATTFSRKT